MVPGTGNSGPIRQRRALLLADGGGGETLGRLARILVVQRSHALVRHHRRLGSSDILRRDGVGRPAWSGPKILG